MLFESVDLKSESENILSKIEKNNRIASDLRNKITRLQAIATDSPIVPENISFSTTNHDDLDEVSEDSSFEDEISFYLDEYRKLGADFNDEELVEILPSSSSYDYRDILMRLMAESVKEIKEMAEIMLDENDASQVVEIKRYIECEKRKIAIIKELLKPKSVVVGGPVKKVHNNIVLAPSSTGAIRVLDDIDHISDEYNPFFRELIDSIIDGTFKNVKRFTHNNILNGICEVRGHKSRVLFHRISKNNYALITAFVKRTERPRGYQEFIKLRVNDYRSTEGQLLRMLDDPEFIKINDKNIKELDRLLGGTEKAPEYKKEVQ